MQCKICRYSNKPAAASFTRPKFNGTCRNREIAQTLARADRLFWRENDGLIPDRSCALSCLDSLLLCPYTFIAVENQGIRKAKIRDVPTLQRFLLESQRLFTKMECNAYCKHRGYDVHKF